MKLESEVNNELSKVYQWLGSNKLTLNISKSKFMLVTKKKKLDISIKIDNEELEQCNTYKYLGVMFDKDLSWKPHIDYISSKIAKACGAIAKTRHFVGINTLKNIYYALVNSYLRYGLTAWGNASHHSLQTLQSLINRVVRIMTFAPLGRLNTKPVFIHLDILDVKQTFTFESAKFLFKSKNGLLPISSIAQHFNRPMPALNRPSRSTRNSSIPLELRSEFAKKSIQVRQQSFWNDIPLQIRQSENINIFKRHLKKHIINCN